MLKKSLLRDTWLVFPRKHPEVFLAMLSFSYVFPQCGVKISQREKKNRQDVSYELYDCMKDSEFWNYTRMGALRPHHNRRKRPWDLLHIFIKWRFQRSSKWYSKNYTIMLGILCFEGLAHDCSSYVEVNASSQRLGSLWIHRLKDFTRLSTDQKVIVSSLGGLAHPFSEACF